MLAKLNQSFFESGGCRDQELACYAASDADAKGENGPGNSTFSNQVCRTADNFCVRVNTFFHYIIGITFGSHRLTLFQVDNVFVPAVGDRDSDDLRQNASSPNPFPPEFYVTFLRNATIMEKIGAEARYSECPDAPFELFERTGDVREFFVLYEWVVDVEADVDLFTNLLFFNILLAVFTSSALWLSWT